MPTIIEGTCRVVGEAVDVVNDSSESMGAGGCLMFVIALSSSCAIVGIVAVLAELVP